LRRALTIAEKRGYVARNVARLVEPPETPRPKLDDTPTLDEMRLLLKAAKSSRLHAYFLTLTAGLRPSEALALQWSAVDLDAGTVTVNRTFQRMRDGRGIVAGIPKTERSKRTVLLPGIVFEALRDHRERQHAERARAEYWEDDDLVFATAHGTPIDQRNAAREFQKVCDTAGVARRRQYSLRHAAATLPLEAGARLEAVSDALGHASLAFTKDVYVSRTTALQRQSADVMDALLRADT
jgi:integrase